jgi:hypothetical protein
MRLYALLSENVCVCVFFRMKATFEGLRGVFTEFNRGYTRSPNLNLVAH